MEKRTLEQVKLYVLRLKPLAGNPEESHVACIGFRHDLLKQWYAEQLTEDGASYEEAGFTKVFKKGSPVEMYAAPPSLEIHHADIYGHGVVEDWVPAENLSRIYEQYKSVWVGDTPTQA